MDIKMDYFEALRLVSMFGRDGFLDTFKAKFPELKLYKFSLDWMEDSRFGCKIKGVRGDLLIKWM